MFKFLKPKDCKKKVEKLNDDDIFKSIHAPLIQNDEDNFGEITTENINSSSAITILKKGKENDINDKDNHNHIDHEDNHNHDQHEHDFDFHDHEHGIYNFLKI